jgi:DNA-directed RNA polymerase subunit RPC12/RpoP
MKDLIRKVLREMVTKTEVICDKCGWSWDIADGGDDLYICHECGHDNEPIKEGELTERCWKGYTQKGMKTMFGKRYPNCVKIKKK